MGRVLSLPQVLIAIFLQNFSGIFYEPEFQICVDHGSI